MLLDSDEAELSKTPELKQLLLPAPPPLPVGAAVESARKALADSLETQCGNLKLLVIMTCLGGTTGGFYTQAAFQFAKNRDLPAVAFAALPHVSDDEDCHYYAETILNALRAEHFEVQTLDCHRLGHLFPDQSSTKAAYSQAVRWLAESLLGYLQLLLPAVAAAPETENTPRTLHLESAPKGIFAGTHPTVLHDEDLDIPTYLRKDIKLPLS